MVGTVQHHLVVALALAAMAVVAAYPLLAVDPAALAATVAYLPAGSLLALGQE